MRSLQPAQLGAALQHPVAEGDASLQFAPLPLNMTVSHLAIVGAYMTIPEVVSIVKDILLAAAAVTTGTVAVLGLNNWSTELRGKTKFEAARNLMRATYRVRDELQKGRSPFVSASEFPSDYVGPRDATAEQQAEAWRFVYSKRWAPVLEALQEFEIHVLETEALWGSEIRAKADGLRRCAVKLQTAMQAFIDNKAHRSENFRADKEFAKEVESDLYDCNENKINSLGNEIKVAVTAIENVVKPHLRRR